MRLPCQTTRLRQGEGREVMAIRALIIHPDFAHRVNDNGTVDSICLHCFGTVASLPEEKGLEQTEIAHSCWQHVRFTQTAQGWRTMASPLAGEPLLHVLIRTFDAIFQCGKDQLI